MFWNAPFILQPTARLRVKRNTYSGRLVRALSVFQVVVLPRPSSFGHLIRNDSCISESLFCYCWTQTSHQLLHSHIYNFFFSNTRGRRTAWRRSLYCIKHQGVNKLLILDYYSCLALLHLSSNLQCYFLSKNLQCYSLHILTVSILNRSKK